MYPLALLGLLVNAVLSSVQHSAYRWLAAIALPCTGDVLGVNATRAIIRQFAGPRFHFRINVFDGTRSCLSSHPHVVVSYIPGYMCLFWKRVLVPSLTDQYDRVFLLDNDVRLSPRLGFTLSAIDEWLAYTGAMIMQPSVIAGSRPGGESERPGTGVRGHYGFSAECSAHVVASPERLHISRPEAYRVLWDLLDNIPDDRLSTDSGLLMLWTQLTCERFAPRPAAIIAQSMQVVHLDTHTIRKAGLDPLYNHPAKKKMNVLFYLWNHPVYGRYANGSMGRRMAQRCGQFPSKVDEMTAKTRLAKKPQQGVPLLAVASRRCTRRCHGRACGASAARQRQCCT